MQKIELATDFPYIEIVKPAKNYVPEWYARTPKFLGGKESEKIGVNAAIRSCVPFMDPFLTGYMAVTSVDIYVSQTVHGPMLKWPDQSAANNDYVEPLSVRGPEITNPMPVPNGYSDKHFVWHNPHLIKTPKNYSILITHPLNQYDLPFFTLSGLIDTDVHILTSGRIPFFVKEGFEGLVPKGTPIYQIIPIKRDTWERVENPQLVKDNRRRMWESGSVMSGWYRKKIWNKKEYN
jgi:hypothetical protein